MTHGAAEPVIGLGAVGTRELALVDRGGGVSPAGSGWRMQFLVRSDERWHVPIDEPSTRQETIEGVSGVRTRVRVPGGDIVATASVALDPSGQPHARVDIRNTTPLPVGIAVLIRSGDPAGEHRVTSVTAVTGGLRLGNAQVIAFPKEPGALVSAASADELLDAIFADQTATATAAASSVQGMAAAAAVFPVAHATGLALSVSLRRSDASPVDSLPDADTVAKGWAAHLGRGSRVVTGDAAVDPALAKARQRLLIAAGDGVPGSWPGNDAVADLRLRGAVAIALATWGFDTEVGAVLHHLAAELDDGDAMVASAWLVAAEAGRLVDHAHTATAENLAAAVATIDMARRRPRRRKGDTAGLVHVPTATDPFDPVHSVWAVAGLEAATRSLRALGQPDAAERVARMAGDLRSALPPHQRAIDPTVAALGPWFDPEHRAPAPVLDLDTPDPFHTALALASFPRRLVVATAVGFDVVASPVPGGNWELHDLPTDLGTLSLAVRWHGPRAALLWELPGGRLTASSYDRTFATNEATGEALLASDGF